MSRNSMRSTRRRRATNDWYSTSLPPARHASGQPSFEHHWLMRRSDRIRTYMYIGAAVASFAVAVALGISLMSNPDFSRADVSALFSIACVLVVSVSLLWIRYIQK